MDDTLELMVTHDERAAFAARFNEALDAADVPPKFKGRQEIVAQMFDVSQKGARKWLEGEAIPNTKRLPAMADRLGVRVEWLLMGRGDKRAEHRVSEGNPASYEAPLTAPQRVLLDLFDGLTKAQQEKLIRELEGTKQTNEDMLEQLLARRTAG